MENDLKTKIELFSALQILPLLFLPLLCELPYDSETANFHGSLIGEGHLVTSVRHHLRLQ